MRNVNNNNNAFDRCDEILANGELISLDEFQLGADEAHQREIEACWEDRDADLCICSDPTDGHEARCPQA